MNQYQVPIDDNGNPILESPSLKALEAEKAEASKVEERPSWLPDKYKSVDDFLKSSEELQKKFTQTSQENAELRKKAEPGDVDTGGKEGPKPAADIPSKVAPSSEIDKTAQEVVQSAGLNFDTLSNEFLEAGDLSKESREALGKIIPEKYIDAYLEGIRASEALATMEVVNSVGGEENFNAMVSWAANNMTEGQRAAYNKAVKSNDIEQATLAVQGLYARFTGSAGSEPKLLSATQSDTSGSDAFKSTAEIKAAMGDPRYMKDTAYRRSVDEKLHRSKGVYNRG